MSRALTAVCVPALILALTLVATPAAAADEPLTLAGQEGSAYAPDRVIVGWKTEQGAAAAVQAHGLGSAEDLAGPGLAQLVSTAARPVDQVLAELRSDPAVAFAEPDYVVHLADEGSVQAVAVDDPLTDDQYALDRMMVRDAWSIETGASNLVAVLDTGVQFAHPDLAGRTVAGYDFVNTDADASDDNGHGTWVAGVIAANANNGRGGAGVSWSDRILPVKIMSAAGTGYTSDLTAGIIYAADRGAKVINMSVGGFPYSQYTLDAVNYAWSRGAVLFGAAGNNAREEVFYPASYGNVLSVSATQVDDELASWSSYGPLNDLSAPGASVLTTNCEACKPAEGGPYTYISGTSFAAPNAAAVAALIFARNPGWTNRQVVDRLLATADDLGYAGWDSRYGYGRVNAYRALGGSPAAPPIAPGDALEPNNSLSTARLVGLGTIRPSLHPAGDVDVVAVDVPRAGRLDVNVMGMTDSRPWPWTRSALPIDPVIGIYDSLGSLLVQRDATGSGSPELASVQVGGPARLRVHVSNWYPNGSRTAYTLTTAFVDNVAPVVTARYPAPGSSGIMRFATSVATFNEPVVGASTATVSLRDVSTGVAAPVSVTTAASGLQVQVRPTAQLAAQRRYRIELGGGVSDAAGNPLAGTSWEFTTGLWGYSDIEGTPFADDIAWLTESGITAGCAVDRFCPSFPVTRAQMASFLVRALHLPAASADAFTDDAGSIHEADINALAASGITGGCGAGRFCPEATVSREQMASFLVRALVLPAVATDYFSDDAGSIHEADINALAASRITGGCGGGNFCPRAVVTREQMAAFLHRAFAG